MHKLKIALLALLIFCGAVACGSKNKSVNITKDGSVYEYENVSFSYPNTFKNLNQSTGSERMLLDNVNVLFTKNTEEITLSIDPVIENNKVEELVQLFRVGIETTGAVILSNTKVTLDNGDGCYEIVSSKDGYKAKYLFLFEEGNRYCLKYRALEEDYDQKIIDIDKYLYTFTVKEGGE